MKKGTDYFSHDYNAANDYKILRLRQQLGMEGYGIYWFLVESLASSGGFLPIDIVPVLSMQMHTTETKVMGVIQNYDLFQVIEGQFFSKRLNDHLELRKAMSEFGKKGAAVKWKDREAIGVANGEAISTPYAKESKESKVKKVNKEKKLAPPFLNDYGLRISKEAYHSVKRKLLSDCQLNEIYKSFIGINYTEETDKEPDEIYRHFTNWLKYQKIEVEELNDFQKQAALIRLQQQQNGVTNIA